MAANRFDRPIDSQFINTYVPIPFEQMMQAGAMKQQRYDQSAGALDASIARAENINAAPGTKDVLNRDAALDRIYAIRDKYAGKDLSDSMVIRQLNNEIRSAVKPSDIKKWEATYAGWERQQKHKQVQIARGEYNPLIDEDPLNIEGGYDSSVQGVYDYLSPTYKGKEETLGKYFEGLRRGRLQPGQTAEGYGTIGVSQSDINQVLEQANQYATTPGGQDEISILRKENPELAAQLGNDDENIARYIMNDYAQQFKGTYGLTGSRTPVGRVGSGALGTPRGFSGILDMPADVANVTGREARTTGKELASEVAVKQTTLNNLVKSEASDEEIAAVQADLDNAKERQVEYDSRYNKVSAIIDAEFADEEKGHTEEYFNKIMNIGGVSENELRRMMGTVLDLGSKPGLQQTGMTNFVDMLAKAIKEEMPNVPFKIRRQLAAYGTDMQPIAATKSRALDEALNQELSEASTTTAIPLRQQKNTNGYMQFAGVDNRMYDSFIEAQFTGPVKNNPGSFELHADNYSVNNKKDLDKYVRLAALEGTDKDKGYSLNLTSIKGAPNAKGGVDLYYTLSGPDIPGDLKSTTVTLSANKPKQIQNVMADLIMQGDSDAAMTFAYGAFMPKAQSEGAGSYKIQYPNVSGEGHPVYETTAEVTYNTSTDEYDITLGGQVVGTAKNRNELGMAIIEIQKWAVQNAAYLSGNQ